jgi:hypothetical protein
MKKDTTLSLILWFILFGAMCHAYGETKKENKEENGIPIVLIASSSTAEPSRASNIITTLNGHVLTVVFTENLGQVSVEVATTAGASVECISLLTPNGLQVYIPNAGNYIVTFTLPNGDVYYGEFTVTD